MSTRKSMAWVGTLALLLAGSLAASLTVKAAEKSDSEQVSNLLSEARTMAFQLKVDAQTMESFTRVNVTWQSHAAAITQIKDHANALAAQVDRLKFAREDASPWQRTAIDRIDPYLNEMSGYVEAVIENLNQHPERLNTAEYKDYLQANADYASDLADMIGSFVDYGRTKERLEHQAERLEVPIT
jgi:hypothetical protein